MNQDPFIFIQEVSSTNDYLSSIVLDKKLNDNELDNFTVVYADWQTAGKGLSGNKWESRPKENILASFYIKEPVSPSRQFFINIAFALSVRKMLSRHLPSVKIKWPNDIYVHEKKMAGILIEHAIQGNELRYSIAGVGINLNQTRFDPLLTKVTSLKLETGYEYERITLLKQLHQILTGHYAGFLTKEDFDILLKEYYGNLYRIKEFHTYVIHGTRMEAMITGVDEYGRLSLEDRQGRQFICGYKEVVYI